MKRYAVFPLPLSTTVRRTSRHCRSLIDRKRTMFWVTQDGVLLWAIYNSGFKPAGCRMTSCWLHSIYTSMILPNHTPFWVHLSQPKYAECCFIPLTIARAGASHAINLSVTWTFLPSYCRPFCKIWDNSSTVSCKKSRFSGLDVPHVTAMGKLYENATQDWPQNCVWTAE